MSPHLSGIIRFEVDKVLALSYGDQYSPEVEVGGVLWRANVCKQWDGNRDHLSIFISCIPLRSMPYSIKVNADYILFNADSAKNATVTRSDTLCTDDNLGGCGEFITWNDLINEGKGFMKEDKIIIEIRFTITSMKGIRFVPPVDFTDPNEPSHDVTLVIAGEKIYANRGILAVHSPVFQAMFYGNFEEKNKQEIELKEEFLEMLHVIYPPYKTVTADSAEYLIKIGDQFQVSCVLDRAEDFLIDSDEICEIQKLRIAEKYRLFGLSEHCISALGPAKDFNRIQESPIFGDLSAETVKALLARAVENLN